MLSMALPLFYVITGYLSGSVCSAVIVCRLFSLPDPRVEGSKNPGATNVLRLAGKKYALLVLFTDMLKGFLPVIIAKALGADTTVLGYVCFAAVLGHMYPLFFNFKGGKGVATALGVLLGFHWLLGGMVIATWLVVALISRYSSLASVLSIILTPLYSLIILKNMQAFIPLGLIMIFILYKHHSNMTRLLDKTEPKINLKKSQEASEPSHQSPK